MIIKNLTTKKTSSFRTECQMNLLLIKYLLKISTNKFVKGIAQCQTDLKNFFLARRFLVKMSFYEAFIAGN